MFLVTLSLLIITLISSAIIIKKCAYKIQDQKETISYQKKMLDDFNEANNNLRSLTNDALNSKEIKHIIAKNKDLQKENKSLKYTYTNLKKSYERLLIGKM